MSGSVGERALNGTWESISNKRIRIPEDITMEFKGKSCNIMDGEKIIESINAPKDKEEVEVTRDVSKGNFCYIMLANIKFEKRHNIG